MRKVSWGVGLLITLAWGMSGAIAQNKNVGYYELVSQSGDTATYQRTHSIYVAGAHNEPVYPGDHVVNFGGGGQCPGGDGPPGQADCLPFDSDDGGAWFQGDAFLVEESGLRFVEGGFWFQGSRDNDDTPDRVTVNGVCGWICAQSVVIVMITAQSGPTPEDLFGIIREIGDLVTPDQPEACTAQAVGSMGGLLGSALQALIANFLNTAAATQMWLDSNHYPGMGFDLRKETAGILHPDGTFERLTVNNAGPCGGTPVYNGPSLHDTGAIFVHTQPHRRGEAPICPQNPQGYTYGNRPSEFDVQWISNYGIDLGLIIDADGIIVFTPDYDPEHDPLDSDEAHYKIDDDGKCGVGRY